MEENIDSLLKQNTQKVTNNKNSLESLLSENISTEQNPYTYQGRSGVISPTDLNSQYDTGIGSGHTYEDIQENRAQSQSKLDRWGNAVPRLASKVLTEVAKIPGYLGGGIGYLTSGDYTAQNFADYIDNSWVQGLQSLDDETKKKFEIYTPKSVSNGTIWDNLTSTSFYTNEGVDGLGFLVAALAPGAALKGFGLGANMARLLGQGAKTAEGIDLALATGTNTLYESMSEANGIKQDLDRVFNEKIKNGEINPSTGKAWTKEEANEVIGEAARDSFLSNMAILLGPNFLMNKNLFGRFNTTKTAISRVTDEAGNILKEIPKQSTKQQVFDTLGKIGLNIASEGFWEEGSQFAVENYLKKAALKETDKDYLSGILDEYMDGLGTLEGQKSIALGGFFGGISGGIGAVREGKQLNKQLNGLRDLLDNNLNAYSTKLTDLYKKDDKGNIILEDGKPVKDPNKVAKVLETFAKLQTRNGLKDVYAITGNKDGFDFIRNDEFTDFAYPYLSQEGGVDLLYKHIDALSSKIKDELDQVHGLDTNSEPDIKTLLKSKARELQKIYDRAQLYGPDYTKLKAKKEHQEDLNNFTSKIQYTMVSEYARQGFYRSKINELGVKIAELSLSTLPLDKEALMQSEKQLKEYQEALEKSEKNYKDLFSTEKQQKLFDESIKKKIPVTKEEIAEKEAESKKESKPETPKDDKKDQDKKNKNTPKPPVVDEDGEEIDPNEKSPALTKANLEFSNVGTSKTREQLLEEVKNGRPYDDLSEEEKDILAETPGKEVKVEQPTVSEPKQETESAPKSNHRGAQEFTVIFNVGKDGKDLLTSLIKDVPDLTDKLYLKVSKNPNAGKKTELKGNKLVKNNASNLNYALYYDNQVVAYIPFYDRFVGLDDAPIDFTNLTEKQYKTLFNPDEKHTLKDFKEAYFRLRDFQKHLERQLGNKEFYPLSNEEIKKLAEFRYTSGYLNINLTPLEELKDIILYEDNLPVIVERQHVFIEGVPVDELKTAKGIFSNLSDDKGEIKTKYNEALNWLDAHPELWSRYTVLVEDPTFGPFEIDGIKYSWIALHPTAIQDQEELFTKLKEQSAKYKKKAPTLDELQTFNNEIEEFTYISAKFGANLALTVHKNGGFQFTYFISGQEKPINIFVENTSKIKDMSDIIREFNIEKKALTDKYGVLAQFRNLTKDDFKINIPKNLDPNENILSYFSSITDKTIRTGQNLELVFKDNNKYEDISQNTELQKELPPAQLETEEYSDDMEIGTSTKDPNNPTFNSSSVYNDEQIKDFDVAVQEIRKLLPDSIPVLDYTNTLDRIKNEGMTFGMFKDGVIYIMENTPEGTQYHEAFHAVLNMLLSKQEAQGLLNTIKSKNNFKTFLQAEEYMADEFAKYKLKRKAQGILASFFQRIIDWFNFLISNDSELTSLFYKIDRGDFRRSSIVRNHYGTKYKILPRASIKDKNGVFRESSASGERSEQILDTVTAMVYAELKGNVVSTKANNKKLAIAITNSILDKQAEVYDPRKYPELSVPQKIKLRNEFLTFTKENVKGREIIIDEVLKRIEIDNYTQVELDEDTDELPEEGDNTEGKEERKGKTFDQSQEEVGGYNKLSKELRKKIALTLYTDTETFSIPVQMAVNKKTVYDGITKACANTPDNYDFIQKFLEFAKISEQGKYFINSIKEELELQTNELDRTYKINLSKTNLLQQIIKGFQKYELNYLHLSIDKKSVDNVIADIQNAVSRGIDKEQVGKWETVYDGKNLTLEQGKAVAKSLRNINNILGRSEQLSNSELEDRIQYIKDYFLGAGIKVSKGYVKYIILCSPHRLHKSDEQIMFVDLYKHNVKDTYKDIIESVEQIASLIELGKNPFKKEFDAEGKEIEGSGAVNRLRRIAKDNAIFDESIVQPTFTSSEGKTIYLYQDSTFNILDTIKISQLAPDKLDAFQKNNFLFNNEKFQLIKSQLKINRIEGLRERDLKEDEENKEYVIDNTKQQRDGVSFSNFTSRELAVFLYSSYAEAKTRTIGTKSVTVFNTPITIMESSSAFDMVELPVYEMYNDSGFTDLFKETIFNEIKNEYNRIQRVDSIKDEIQNYNTGAMRGYDFFVFKELLSYDSELIKDLKTQTPDELKDEIYKQIEKYYNAEFEEHLNILKQEEIIKERNGQILNTLLDKRYLGKKMSSKNSPFTSNKLKTNIAQAYFNSLINSMSYNQLLTSDPAETTKNVLDWFKRAKMNNASGMNFYRPDFVESKFIIIGERAANGTIKDIQQLADPSVILSADKKNIDVMDGYSVATIGYFREIAISLGRHSESIKRVYNKIEEGEKLNEKDLKILKDEESFMNAKKIVGADKFNYLKMSTGLLSRHQVSYRASNKQWKALPGFEYWHNLLNEMEKNKVHLALSPSASKRRIVNPIHKDGDFVEIKPENIQTIDNHYMRLQQENPSNKLRITDPTQMKDIIDFEQDDNLEITLPNGSKTTIGKIKKEYQENLAAKTDMLYRQYKSLLYTLQKGVLTPDLAKFQKTAIETLQKTGASQQLLDLFMVNNFNKPEYNLNTPAALTKFTSLFHAHFSKVLMHDIPGYKVTLRPSYEHPVYENRKTKQILTLDEFRHEPGKYLDGNSLKSEYLIRDLEYNKVDPVTGEIYSEVIVSKHFLEQYHLEPGQNIPKEISTLFGVRIPSQDKHSALVLRIVDSLDMEYGSDMMFPKEIIPLTGSDFDIDAFYIHRPEHYFLDGKFKTFGNKEDSAYHQYLIYNYLYNPLVKSLMKDEEFDLKDIFKEREESEDLSFIYADRHKKPDERYLAEAKRLERVLKQLNIPSTEEEFNEESKNTKLNIGEIDNNILKQKILLHTNPHIQEKIAKTPATKDEVEDAMDYLLDLLNNPKELESIFGFNGLIRAHYSNTAGNDSIAPAVNSTKIYTFLNKYKVQLKDGYEITFNGKKLDSYANTINEEEKRIMDILSSITSAMTDNAKDGFVSKLNLILNALPVVCNLVSLGVPFRDCILLINVPSVKKYLQKTQSKTLKSEDEINKKETIFSNMLGAIRGELAKAKYEGKLPTKKEVRDFNSEDLIKTISKNLDSTQDLLNNYKYLLLFRALEEQTEYFSDLGHYLKLTKGMKNTFSDNDRIEEKYVKLTTNNPTMDLSDAFKEDKVHSTNYAKFSEIREDAKLLFIERSDLFQHLSKVAQAQFKFDLVNSRDALDTLRRNLLSFIISTGYRKFYEDSKDKTFPNLNILLNQEIAEKEGVLSFKQLYDKLYREVPEFKNNPAIRLLGSPIRKDGIDRIDFNSFTKAHKGFENKFIDGFVELYTDERTRPYVHYCFNYLLAKDSLQFKNDSFLGLIPAFMFKPMSKSIDKMLELFGMKSEIDYSHLYEQILGASQDKLLIEFLKKSGRDGSNYINLPYQSALPESKAVNLSKGVLTFDKWIGTKSPQGFTATPDTTKEEIEEWVEEKEQADKQLSLNYKALDSIDFLGHAYYKYTNKKTGKEETGKSYVFPFTIKIKRDVYQIQSVNGQELKFDEEGRLIGDKAVYQKVSLLGGKGLNIAARTLKELEELGAVKLTKKTNEGTLVEAPMPESEDDYLAKKREKVREKPNKKDITDVVNDDYQDYAKLMASYDPNEGAPMATDRDGGIELVDLDKEINDKINNKEIKKKCPPKK